MGVPCKDIVQVLRQLKEELAWATDKQLQVISTAIIELKNKAVSSLKQYCMHYYVVLSNVF